MSLARIAQVLELARESLYGALKTITYDHAKIHDGHLYTAAFQLSIESGAVSKMTLLTPAAALGSVHYRPATFVTSGDKMTLKFYEGASGNSGGSAVTPSNRNRTNTSASDVVVKTGVTVTTNGTQISEAYIPGATGVGGSRNGGNANGENEWVLKPATLYVIECTNGSSAANILFTELQWYE